MLLMLVNSYWFGSILLVVLLRPLKEERLGGAGLVPAEPEAAVEALDVGEHALPVRLLHAHHVLHVEQGADVAVFPANMRDSVQIDLCSRPNQPLDLVFSSSES